MLRMSILKIEIEDWINTLNNYRDRIHSNIPLKSNILTIEGVNIMHREKQVHVKNVA